MVVWKNVVFNESMLETLIFRDVLEKWYVEVDVVNNSRSSPVVCPADPSLI